MIRPLSQWTPQELTCLLRNDFSSFIAMAFGLLNPGTRYLHNWHVDLIAAKLVAFADGRIKRLVIVLPPRSLKSHCASVCLPAYILGRDPTRQIVCASYSQDLANFHARACRKLMTSAEYQSIFPWARLLREKTSAEEFVTTANGLRLATSVGGTLTGKGGDFVIVDDPIKAEDAFSETERNRTNEWYGNTLFSRLNDKANGGVLIIMQRLHQNDLAGYVSQQEGWEVVSLPAIAEQDEVFEYETLLGPGRHRRKGGTALHEERESLESLHKIKMQIGQYNFSGQYQQRPAPLGGGILKIEWFHHYQGSDLPAKPELVVQSWDTASKESQLADYSVCTTWWMKDDRSYLIDVLRIKADFPRLRDKAIELARQYHPNYILVEDKSSGTQLAQDLPLHRVEGVTAFKPIGDKFVRAMRVSSLFENGRVLLPPAAPWLAEYVQELTTFPAGLHDDQVDSTTQALEWIQQYPTMPGMGLLMYMKAEAERLQDRS